jgi:hypothetical protein
VVLAILLVIPFILSSSGLILLWPIVRLVKVVAAVAAFAVIKFRNISGIN